MGDRWGTVRPHIFFGGLPTPAVLLGIDFLFKHRSRQRVLDSAWYGYYKCRGSRCGALRFDQRRRCLCTRELLRRSKLSRAPDRRWTISRHWRPGTGQHCGVACLPCLGAGPCWPAGARRHRLGLNSQRAVRAIELCRPIDFPRPARGGTTQHFYMTL